jgi:phosphatidylglycerophosphate synthase
VGYRDTLRRLSGAQKSATGAPLYSLLVNRPLGRMLAAAAYVLGMTPNRVTLVSALFTYGGIVVLATATPGWVTGAAVTAALVLGYALDSADGQVARLQGGGSPAGEWLDHVIDSGKIATLHLAVLVMAYRHLDVDSRWLLVPLAFSVASVVHFFGMLLTELLMRIAYLRHGGEPPARAASTLMSVLKLPTDYGLLCLSFLLLGAPSAFLVCYTVLALAMVAYTAPVAVRWYRSIAALT